MQKLFSKVCSKAGKLAGDSSGNAAIMVTLALPFLVLSIGGGADYARILAARQKLQAAADSAVLATYQHYTADSRRPLSEIKTYFESQLRASLHSKFEQDIKLKSVALTLQKNNQKLQARVQADYPTTFIRLAGIPSISLNVEAEVQASVNYTEVALVLDTTGSMRGAKLNELKRAATNFLNTIHKRLKGNKETFKVAIVPFSEYVNVGKQYRNASWIRVPRDRIVSKTGSRRVCRRFRCDKVLRQPYMRCEWRGNPDGGRYRVCRWDYRNVCVKWHWQYFNPCLNARYTVRRLIQWQGCVGSRRHPLDVKDEGYGVRVPGVMNYARLTRAPESSYNGWDYSKRNQCPVPLTPLMDLKNHKDDLVKKINGLRARGYTYIPSGLMWGWRVLSHKAPFMQGASDSEVLQKNVRKIIILMTDGKNTRAPERRAGRLYQDHTQPDRSYADQMLKKACNNIKQINPATGRPYADIITITFDVRDAQTKSLLRDCASLGSFDARSGQLLRIFDNIAEQLVELHLSK